MSVPEQHWERPDTSTLGLTEVMALMRKRCPWAAAHTHDTLEKYLLEETYELLEALRTGERTEIVGELGDVLYQVIFHAALLDEEDGLAAGTSMHQVEDTLKAKLIRRHPHVFDSDGPVPIAEVERRYEEIKADERAQKAEKRAQTSESVNEAEQPLATSGAEAARRAAESFASVPASLPALARADAILGRCERLGIEPTVPAEPIDPAESAGSAESANGPESANGLESATGPGAANGPEPVGGPEGGHGLGARLFALVADAHAAGLDPEAALRDYTAAVERTTVD